ncbi:MAG: type III-B CRISPR module RAMP protein Cmr4 [Candidatus Altiarchaeales archaeon WOR_SM1_79]|nr:MAG: type III-B CRISPR module RAMP protein Cmr4 [Candidatus Altiarchaeales archaeon WOR_SM1_79]
MTNNIYKQKRYFGMALDPIHIGTGGYRLGRVDNAIVREPGSNIPKIPGTSIEGVARTYSYYKEIESIGECKPKEKICAVGKKMKIKGEEKEPCGNCPVCITYGYTTDEKSLHGMAQFSDARILFFPVHSMIGPVWVTTAEILKEIVTKDDKNKITNASVENTIKIGDKIHTNNSQKLNLGWLYLKTEKGGDIKNINVDIGDNETKKLNEVINEEILKRYVIVSGELFQQIVNSNLEVRTSVAIDPTTGAAEEGALYTYEAIPRATVFWFSVTANNPKNFDVPDNWKSKSPDDVINKVNAGLELFEFLGVGGMGTRGFGRLRILNLNENGGDRNE